MFEEKSTEEAIAGLKDGLPGVRRLVHSLGYDYSNELLPTKDTFLHGLFTEAPRIVGHAFDAQLKFIHVDMLSPDKLIQDRSVRHYSNTYIHAVFLFTSFSTDDFTICCADPSNTTAPTFRISGDTSSIPPNLSECVANLVVSVDFDETLTSCMDRIRASISSLPAVMGLANLSLRERDKSALDALWQSFSVHELLSQSEIDKLSILARSGNQWAKDKIINANSRLVISIARKYTHPMVPLEDLFQYGVLGLIRAVEKYDPERGFRFSTYATWWIRRAAHRAIITHGRIIVIPVYVNEIFTKIRNEQNSFFCDHARNPSAEELSRIIGIGPKEVNHFIQSNFRVLSLDSDVNIDETTRITHLSPASSEAGNPEWHFIMQDKVIRFLSHLKEREQTVVCLRFGVLGNREHTLEEAGKIIGVTRERVRQIEMRAMKKLACLAENEEADELESPHVIHSPRSKSKVIPTPRAMPQQSKSKESSEITIVVEEPPLQVTQPAQSVDTNSRSDNKQEADFKKTVDYPPVFTGAKYNPIVSILSTEVLAKVVK